MELGKIFYAHEDDRCFIKLAGDMKYPISNELSRVINDVCANEDNKIFVIDLSDVTSIDSTNLGLMAKIARCAHERKCDMPIIISINENINIILRSMGLGDVFKIVNMRHEVATHLVGVNPLKNEQKQSLSRIMLDAHETLIEVNENNRNKFEDVCSLLRHELSFFEDTK